MMKIPSWVGTPIPSNVEIELSSDDLCPETERSPISSVPPRRTPHTVDDVTVMAYNHADAVATIYKLF